MGEDGESILKASLELFIIYSVVLIKLRINVNECQESWQKEALWHLDDIVIREMCVPL